MEHSQNKKEVIEKFDKYCDDQKRLILEGQLTKQLIEEGIAYEIKDGIVILKEGLNKIPNNPKLSYDVIEGLDAGRVLVSDENADYRDGSKTLDEIRKVANKFGKEVETMVNNRNKVASAKRNLSLPERLIKVHEIERLEGLNVNTIDATGKDNPFKPLFKEGLVEKYIGENAFQMELTPKGFKVVNDTPFEYMRKILSNRKVTFYTKKDDTYFLETEGGLIERTEQMLHEDIANCKFDVLIFKDGFIETKGKEDSVSLQDSRFIELLEAINESKDLNTILNLGEQLEFYIARFDKVVDFSLYAEVILSFCIDCNTTVDRETRKAETVRDVLTKRGRANGFHMLLTSKEPTSQQKAKAVCLDKNSSVLNGLSAEQIAYKVYVEDDVENLKEFNGDAVDYKGDKFKTLRMENKQTYESIFINRDNPKIQAILKRIEENPNWDEIIKLARVNNFDIQQVHEDVLVVDSKGEVLLRFKDHQIKKQLLGLSASGGEQPFVNDMMVNAFYLRGGKVDKSRTLKNLVKEDKLDLSESSKPMIVQDRIPQPYEGLDFELNVKNHVESKEVESYLDTLLQTELKDYSKNHLIELMHNKFREIPKERLEQIVDRVFLDRMIPLTTIRVETKSDLATGIEMLISNSGVKVSENLRDFINQRVDSYFETAKGFIAGAKFVVIPIYQVPRTQKDLRRLVDFSMSKYAKGLNGGRLIVADYLPKFDKGLDINVLYGLAYSVEFFLTSVVNESRTKNNAHRNSIDNGYHNLPKLTFVITSKKDLGLAISRLADTEVDEDLVNSVYCHVEPVLNKLGIMKITCVDTSRIEDSKADLIWYIWSNVHRYYPQNEVIPMIDGDPNKLKATGINIFLNNLFGAIRDFKTRKSFDCEDRYVFINKEKLTDKNFVCDSIINLLIEAKRDTIRKGHLSLANNIVGVEIAEFESIKLKNVSTFELRINSDERLEIVYDEEIHPLTTLAFNYEQEEDGIKVYAGMFDSYERKGLNNLTLQDLSFYDFVTRPNYISYLKHSKNEELKNKIKLYYRVHDFIHSNSEKEYKELKELIAETFKDFNTDEFSEVDYENMKNYGVVENIELVRKLINESNEGVDPKIDEAIKIAVEEVSTKFRTQLGRFIEFQMLTGRNVAKKKVKELQHKIEIEQDVERKEELTQELNSEYSVLEQAEVDMEEVDNAESCKISYIIETKVFRMIGKANYLKWKDYIEHKAKVSADSIVEANKHVVDDMTKYLTLSNVAMQPVKTITFAYNKEDMKNFSNEDKLNLLEKVLNKPTIPYFASEILPKDKVLERICIGTRTKKAQSLPFDVYLYSDGNNLMLNYLEENINLQGINYEAFDVILKRGLIVACLDKKAYDKIRGYYNRQNKDSSNVFNLSDYMKTVYGEFTVNATFDIVTGDRTRTFYNLNKVHDVTTKIEK